MKLVSWNVNGIRSILGKGFLDFVAQEDPDILCLQEVKAMAEQVELPLPQYKTYWNSAEKKGYSGTTILTKTEPLSVQLGIGIPKHDREGRVITAEYPDFFVVNCYTPNAQRELTRLTYRAQEWNIDFRNYLCSLDARKPVIFCGDLNVAHTEIDLANPKANRKNAGFTDEERSGFTELIEAGFIDTFREFEKGSGHYTWWSYMNQARSKNIGWRIDYFCVSKALRERLVRAHIYKDIMGSDHCPVGLEILRTLH